MKRRIRRLYEFGGKRVAYCILDRGCRSYVLTCEGKSPSTRLGQTIGPVQSSDVNIGAGASPLPMKSNRRVKSTQSSDRTGFPRGVRMRLQKTRL